jgi:hypothetical protein
MTVQSIGATTEVQRTAAAAGFILSEALFREGPDEITLVVHFVGSTAAAVGCDTSIHRFSRGVSLMAALESMGAGQRGVARLLATPESFVALIQGREAGLSEPLTRDTSVTLMPSTVCLKGITGAHASRPCGIWLDSWSHPSLH